MTAAPTVPESHRDLLDGRFATLATVGPDGRPQLSEVWFLAEDDAVRVSLNVTRQKTRNLVANPVVSLLLLDPREPPALPGAARGRRDHTGRQVLVRGSVGLQVRRGRRPPPDGRPGGRPGSRSPSGRSASSPST
jgi:PPOX class probable F420-dependent enzyme